MRPRAALPMYDWPEVAGALDRLWLRIRGRLVAAGLDAPDRLTRDADLDELWADRDVLVDQVCSLNPVREGAGTVVPLGTIDYRPPSDLPSCGPGEYYSVVVCRADDRRRAGGLPAFTDAPIVANGTDSQSGYWSLGHLVVGLADVPFLGPFFGPCSFSGGHRASIVAVATGAADVAAIDVHSWRLALEHEPAARALDVVTVTDPTPGVVCITGAGSADRVDAIGAALAASVAEVADTPDGRALAVAGYVPRTVDDFDVVARRVAKAAATPWHR